MSEPGKSFRILVIDDSISIVKSLQKILEYLGHQVDTAYGAYEALLKVANNNYEDRKGVG